jgi:hypothetical protein
MFFCAKAADTPSRRLPAHGRARFAPARLVSARAKAYLKAMGKLSGLGTAALIVALLAILTAAGWFAARAWISVEGPPMPANGYIAMALGIVFSLVVGCGLMALLFYSSRHGYDGPDSADDERR